MQDGMAIKYLLPALLCFTTTLLAQQTVSPPPHVADTVVVLGSFDPISEGESARSVDVIDTQHQRLAFPEVNDYLRTDTSADIHQRGTGGTQADISIRGTNFEQTLVLLNGFRINNVETAHFNLNLPVPLDAIANIDILHGAGSTLYGSDAIGGVVDYITANPTASSLRLRIGGSSFGGQQQAIVAGIVRGKWSEVLAGSHDASQGFTADRDFSSRQGSSETRVNTALGETDILFAVADQPYGANLFYGPYDSFERTKNWFAAARQQLGPQTSIALAYRRNTDEFILFRENPAAYENNHVDQNWQATLRRADRLAKNTRIFYGLEENTDQIQSTSLGNHARNNGAGYTQVELRIPNRATLSAGARLLIDSNGNRVFSPSFSASYRLPHEVKLRASAGHGFRLPTFLDLYYSDPSHAGNAKLVPETNWNFDGGADWYPGASTTASLTFFYSPQHNTIDYERPVTSTGVYTAANLPSLRYLGVEASLTWKPTSHEQIILSYTGINGAPPVLNGETSLYAAAYAVNNGSFTWTDALPHSILLRTRIGLEQHVNQTAYPIWDMSASKQRGWIRPYLQIANLSNTGYAEILAPSAVPMPPRSFAGGVEFDLGGRALKNVRIKNLKRLASR
jgi:iron complex outermembrane receptor protein